MDNALYVGLSKQMLLERELDITANNMANANTTGFKVESLLSTPDPVTPPGMSLGAAPVQFVADNGATHYLMVNWYTPAGLGAWGDGRAFILGNEAAVDAGVRDVRAI